MARGLKPPALIHVGPYRYRVLLDVKAFENPADDRVLGETAPDKLTIVIRPGLPPDIERVVVWHELTHVVMSLFGWLGEKPIRASEEAITDLVSQAQMDVLRRNPRLVAYLCADA